MNDIRSVGSQAALRFMTGYERVPAKVLTTEERDARLADRLDLSDRAVDLSRMNDPALGRSARLDRLRDMIRNDSYETSDRIQATAERLIEVLQLG